MSLDWKDIIEPLKDHMHARENQKCKLESRPFLSKKTISKS